MRTAPVPRHSRPQVVTGLGGGPGTPCLEVAGVVSKQRNATGLSRSIIWAARSSSWIRTVPLAMGRTITLYWQSAARGSDVLMEMAELVRRNVPIRSMMACFDTRAPSNALNEDLYDSTVAGETAFK